MYIVGITGKPCSGKTSMSEKLQAILGTDKCLLISMEDFYKEASADQQKRQQQQRGRFGDAVIDFDTPDAIDFDLLKKTLVGLKSNREVRLPRFDRAQNAITAWTTAAASKYKFVLVEGLFILNDAELKSLFDLKIWIETSDYVCALRLFKKLSALLTGYSHDLIYDQCIKYVIPGQEKYIKPVKVFCDFFVNGEIENNSSISMISNYILKPS